VAGGATEPGKVTYVPSRSMNADYLKNGQYLLSRKTFIKNKAPK
jgi:hypothetical protein